MSFSGRVALITGGSKGIGKAAALLLAKQGAKVVINYSSDAQAADEVVSNIGKEHGLAVKADVSKVNEIERLVQETVAHFGKIDILYANAGILPMKDLEHTTEQDFDATFNLNVKGPYFLVQVSSPTTLPLRSRSWHFPCP